MTFRIADMPLDEQPRRRLALHGVATLSDSELVAVVLSAGSRGRNALDSARSVLADGLTSLSRREWRTYSKTSGIGETNAAKLAAAFELGRRAVSRDLPVADPVRDPEMLARSLLARFGHFVQERLGAVYLDSKNRIIREREIYIGTLNSATVSTRDVLRHALDEHAASVIVFHNHPSGDPAPSAEDLMFTRKLVEAGKLLGVDVLDHLILGASRYISLKQRGAM
ncbi:MAG TPA: DNA repair protein RadC [Thermoanaerobaculia bacterium]|nr:DNA repair protein RadC [Thermoanaerobaculia bacterium]